MADGRGIGKFGPALGAAALFGAAAPASKVLVGSQDPLVLAALLYLGAGAGLSVGLLVRRALSRASRPKAALRGRDWAFLGGATAAGGFAAPLLFVAGLALSPASTVSLLLNLEMVLTAVLAWLLFHEGFEPKVALGLAGVACGCLVASWPAAGYGWGWGAPAVAAACLCWALDNNLTQRLAERDPLLVAALKGLAGGTANGTLAVVLGREFPSALPAAAALGVGLAGYGLSLVLFIVSLRRVGTARTVGLFSAAPFAGAALAFLVLHEPLSPAFATGALLVAAGLAVALVPLHAHRHAHPLQAHDHEHSHDDHHRHEHGEDAPPGEPHVHEHHHEALEHAHPHVPDSHHRHDHRSAPRGGEPR